MIRIGIVAACAVMVAGANHCGPTPTPTQPAGPTLPEPPVLRACTTDALVAPEGTSGLFPAFGPPGTLVEVLGDDLQGTVIWDSGETSEAQLAGGSTVSSFFTVPRGAAAGMHPVSTEVSGNRTPVAGFSVSGAAIVGACFQGIYFGLWHEAPVPYRLLLTLLTSSTITG